jgi:hypothetical protein
MKNKKLLALIRRFFTLPADFKLSPETEIFRLGGSHDAINFTFWLEKRLKISLSDEESTAISTKNVRKYLKILSQKMKGRTS